MNAPSDRTPTLVPGRRLGRFVLIRSLGQGGFGQVWLASEHSGLGFERPVALKFVIDPMSRLGLQALVIEARIAALLRHVNVIAVNSVELHQNVPFLVMEYIDGGNLAHLARELIRAGLAFPRSVLVEIGIGIADALDHAWNALRPDGSPLRVVHRDLKPANVMLSRDGTVKVADFGMARFTSDLRSTQTGRRKGTPSYMAPELFSGKRNYGPASDLWSLGVILWELAAMRRFVPNSDDLLAVAEKIRHGDPEREVAQVEGSFPELAPMLRRLLQRDPRLRVQTAREAGHLFRSMRKRTVGGDLSQFGRLLERSGIFSQATPTGAGEVRLPSSADNSDLVALVDSANTETVSGVEYGGGHRQPLDEPTRRITRLSQERMRQER